MKNFEGVQTHQESQQFDFSAWEKFFKNVFNNCGTKTNDELLQELYPEIQKHVSKKISKILLIKMDDLFICSTFYTNSKNSKECVLNHFVIQGENQKFTLSNEYIQIDGAKREVHKTEYIEPPEQQQEFNEFESNQQPEFDFKDFDFDFPNPPSSYTHEPYNQETNLNTNETSHQMTGFSGDGYQRNEVFANPLSSYTHETSHQETNETQYPGCYDESTDIENSDVPQYIIF